MSKETFELDSFVWKSNKGRLIVVDQWKIEKPDSYIGNIEFSGLSDEDYQNAIDKAEKEFDEYFANLGKDKRKPSKQPGYIYAVRCGNKLKLGRTVNLDNRFIAYKKVTDEFSILETKYVSEYKKAEKAMLTHFRDGAWTEWFDYTPEFEAQVKEYFHSVEEYKP